MYNAFKLFEKNISEIRHLVELHDYLSLTQKIPMNFDDILRFQIVYALSAFDKLVHDLIRVGMVEIYKGIRPVTPKYLTVTISVDQHANLVSASFPPKELVFQNYIFDKLKIVSYQDPDKVSEGLSHIWSEKQKWLKISNTLRVDESYAKNTLKLISNRRNSIVHEADIDPVTGFKFNISKNDSTDTIDFLYNCGMVIYNLVK